MRKQYKSKRRACALCKPWKRGWAKRWKQKELAKAIDAGEDAEREFWAITDSTEILDWSKAKHVSFPNLKPTCAAKNVAVMHE